MRFITLVKNQLQEILGYLIIVAIIFTLLSSLILWGGIRHPDPYHYSEYSSIIPGDTVSLYTLIQHPKPLSWVGPVLLVSAILLGLLLAQQQFAEQQKRGTWAFTIHRSVSRCTILWARFSAAVIAFVICLGAMWTMFYLYVSAMGASPCPLPVRVLIEGWIFILLGLVVYFGAALSAVSTKKKYTTKYFGAAFAGMILVPALVQVSLALCFAVIALALVILVSDTIDTFLSREF
ncbi:MAG: hypothetical protein ACYS18_08160 [Planctomycetota bacterium]|jgi:ABC-type transport system involved in multi-copper enzyme maturation permease subunit